MSTATRRTFFLAMLLIVGPGCPPDHDGGGDGGDETGGLGDPDPIDPFDDEGADPPGEPDLGRPYKPPSSLGNGLVHDSRYDLKAEPANIYATPEELEAGVDWATFVPSHKEKLRVGFRPAQVDAKVRLSHIWNGKSVLTIDDRAVYVCDDDANYRTVTKTHVFSDLMTERALSASGPSAPGQPRPTAIDGFALGANRFGVHIVWTYDNSPIEWKLVVGQSEDVFQVTLAALAQSDIGRSRSRAANVITRASMPPSSCAMVRRKTIGS